MAGKGGQPMWSCDRWWAGLGHNRPLVIRSELSLLDRLG